MKTDRRWKTPALSTQIFVLHTATMLLVLVAGSAAVYVGARHDADNAARQRVLDVAIAVAHDPTVSASLAGEAPRQALQGIAEQIRVATGVDFVVIMNTEGTRFSHPNPALIGGTFVGTIKPAVQGQALTETTIGSLGPSIRSVVPVRGRTGTVVGLVSVGITTRAIGASVLSRLGVLFAVVAVAAMLAAAGSAAIARRVRRVTHGMKAQEIAALADHRDAILAGVQDGIVAVDESDTVTMVNNAATALLHLPDDLVGRRLVSAGLHPRVLRALSSLAASDPCTVLIGQRALMLSRVAVTIDKHAAGSVITIHDCTDAEALRRDLGFTRHVNRALRTRAEQRALTVSAIKDIAGRQDFHAFSQLAADLGTEDVILADSAWSMITDPPAAAMLVRRARNARWVGVGFRILSTWGVPPLNESLSADLIAVAEEFIDAAEDTIREHKRGDIEVLLEVVADAAYICVHVMTTPGDRPSALPHPDRLPRLDRTRLICDRRGGYSSTYDDHGIVFTAWLPQMDQTAVETPPSTATTPARRAASY
jgi:two-component system CitB family sensor kinase